MTRVGDAQVDGIPGAFWPPDWQVFRALLDATAAGGPGDLAELAVLWRRSAVLIGGALSDDETFTVVDLFEAEPDDTANGTENAQSYPG